MADTSLAGLANRSPPAGTLDRLALLHDLIDRGAERDQAAAMLLAVYADLWESHPRSARRMVIGLHTLHTAIEPYMAGKRPLPGTLRFPAARQTGPADANVLADEIPF